MSAKTTYVEMTRITATETGDAQPRMRGLARKEIARLFGCSERTIYRREQELALQVERVNQRVIRYHMPAVIGLIAAGYTSNRTVAREMGLNLDELIAAAEALHFRSGPANALAVVDPIGSQAKAEAILQVLESAVRPGNPAESAISELLLQGRGRNALKHLFEGIFGLLDEVQPDSVVDRRAR